MLTRGSATPTAAELTAQYGPAEDSSGRMNVERVERARTALDLFADSTNSQNEPLDSVAGDLIADLLHILTVHGEDAQQVHGMAWRHYVAEAPAGYGDDGATE